MKSNKFLLAIAAMAAVSMSSCSQEEELVVPDNQLSDNAVVFGTYIGASRGTELTTSALQNSTEGFGVFAYYTGQDAFGKEGATQTPNFMYNQQVSYKNNAWTYEPLKYWPNTPNDKLSFFAYAPYTATPSGETGTSITAFSANTASGAPTLDFTVAPEVNSQIDLLYADAAATGENQIKDCTKPQTTNTKVGLKFKHALARICFERQLLIDGENMALDAATKITINSVTFKAKNFGVKGTLNLNSGSWKIPEDGYETKDYVLSTTKGNIKNNEITSTSSTDAEALSDANGNIMFIPVIQSNSTEVSTVTINYTVETTDGKLNGGKSSVTNNVTVNVPSSLNFVQGNNYKLILKVGLTTVKLDAVVDTWGNETTEINAQ